MEIEIVKIGKKYGCRYKKWYHFNWIYLGIDSTWGESYCRKSFILCETIKEAEEKRDNWFPEITPINNL